MQCMLLMLGVLSEINLYNSFCKIYMLFLNSKTELKVLGWNSALEII